MEIRLNKAIADAGVCSRRAADELIANGLVMVNGKKVFELGRKVDPHVDKIIVDGKPLSSKPDVVYAMLNKPKGVLTTLDDPKERTTIKEFLPDPDLRLFPVGRLDWDSEGLILLTNDGDYANQVMHPKKEVTKTYLVKIDGQIKPEQMQKLRSGVTIVGGRVKARHIERIRRGKEKYDWVKIVITEGKNRQIRQMFAKVGFDVLKLQRVAIGRLRIGNLDRGELVYLNEAAANRVFQQDLPDEVLAKKSYKGKSGPPSTKRKSSLKKATHSR